MKVRNYAISMGCEMKLTEKQKKLELILDLLLDLANSHSPEGKFIIQQARSDLKSLKYS